MQKSGSLLHGNQWALLLILEKVQEISYELVVNKEIEDERVKEFRFLETIGRTCPGWGIFPIWWARLIRDCIFWGRYEGQVFQSGSPLASIKLQLKVCQCITFLCGKDCAQSMTEMLCRVINNALLWIQIIGSSVHGYKKAAVTRCYCTPSVLQKCFPEATGHYWRCQEEWGMLLHTYRSCLKSELSWKGVRRIIHKITNYPVPADSAFFLLHLLDIPTKTCCMHKKSILYHVFNPARSCISLRWKDPLHPSILLWIDRVEDLL